MTRVGYARVSLLDQDTHPQVEALRQAGCERVYTEYASGARSDRPQLAAALDYLRAGDQLVVARLDRLGRSLPHLIAVVDELRTREVDFRSLSEDLDTTTAAGKLLFHVLAAFAEFERALVRERTEAGLAAARAAGRRGGRRPRLSEHQVRYVQRMHASGVTISELAKGLEVGRATVYRALSPA